MSAADSTHDAQRNALDALCESYWFPVYCYIRSRGSAGGEAEDLTQAFFARLLEEASLKVADRHRGRFRSFLLASVRNFLANEWDRGQAVKRGGGKRPIRLDDEEERLKRFEPSDELTPEDIFDRHWAMTVVEKVLEQLRRQARRSGTEKRFERLAEFITGEGDESYRTVVQELETNEQAIRAAIYRLRRRFGDLLRREIADTVSDPDQVDDELRFLLAALR